MNQLRFERENGPAANIEVCVCEDGVSNSVRTSCLGCEITMRVYTWRRSRLTDRPRIVVAVAAIMVLLILMIVPLRNCLLKFVLPGLWLEHSSLFILKMMLDFQNFPVDATPRGQSTVTVDVNLSDVESKYLFTNSPFQKYYQHMKVLEAKASTDPSLKTELETLQMFKPSMTEKERALSLFTLEVFIRACEKAGLTYFLIAGSLMGAVRHHGFVPWDDDLDIIMNASEWRKIRDVLGNIPEFTLYSPPSLQWKFYLKSLPKSKKPFKWPNVDIFFFNEDQTHIWSQTWGAKVSLCNRKEEVFPLKSRTFELWSLPVPNFYDRLLNKEFKDFMSYCATNEYDHKESRFRTAGESAFIPCSQLHEVYPFVFQQSTMDPRVFLEVRKVGNVTLSNGPLVKKCDTTNQ